MLESEQIEQLADFAHKQWSGWMTYMFGKCIPNEDGTLTIPGRFVRRWSRQVRTSYANLPEGEKESDRKEARKMIDILGDGNDV